MSEKEKSTQGGVSRGEGVINTLPPAGQYAPPAPPRRRRGFFGTLFAFIFAIIKLVFTTALVLGLTGATTYMIVKSYVTGPEVKVPLVLNMTVEEALEELKPTGLLLELDRREDSETVPRGKILTQFPGPYVKVKTHTPLRVVLSDGSVRVRAPQLVGQSEINAGVAVRSVPQAELDLGEDVARVYSSAVKKGDVIAQDPPPGTPVLRGSRIKILVSLGTRPSDFSMPELLNKTIQEARAALGALQLTLGEVREEDRAGTERGIVVAQNPAPGRRVVPGTAVSLIVATGVGGTGGP